MKDTVVQRYPAMRRVDLPDRQWPSSAITTAPIWCSVDLRDGNQSLIDPMDVPTKERFFRHLVALGFKEIEVGFPAAAEAERAIIRQLLRKDLVPDDVTLQVMTQAKEDLIEETFASMAGARRVIVHVYNATAPLFRDVVFGVDRSACKRIATQAMEALCRARDRHPHTEWVFQYSPETFCFTELDFSLEVCEAVMDVAQPTSDEKLILNLPSTVEVTTPNVFADQIEWMHRNLSRRDAIVLSVHPHNDRGTGVASAELALMAGADRLEGTLFGNGERTGNLDLVTVALNMVSTGVNPGLDFSQLNETKALVEACNQLKVPERHPYAGELVFTAFSGSHQDAIRKGFSRMRASQNPRWEMPYLTIDPQDIGRDYEAVIRVNSQSGKAGGTWFVEQEWQVVMPREAQQRLARRVQEEAENSGKEIESARILGIAEALFGHEERASWTRAQSTPPLPA